MSRQLNKPKPSAYTVRRILRDGTVHEREKERRKPNLLPCGWCDRTDRVQRIQFIDWRGALTAIYACPTHSAEAWESIRIEQAPEPKEWRPT